MKIKLATLFLLFIFCSSFAQTNEKPLQIYLVRHAEKATDELNPKDPGLTPEGISRAQYLARMLRSEEIMALFSTDYKRTTQTLDPLAKQHDLDIQLYDPYKMEEFANQLKAMRGTIVVSGHSNTTPALVKTLGGQPGEPISEMEYDRVYLLTFTTAGTVITNLLHYGKNQP